MELDKDVIFNSVVQLWVLQFVFLFLDVFTSFNFGNYGYLSVYSLIVNILFLIVALIKKFSRIVKLGLFTVVFFSLLFFLVGFFDKYKLFTYQAFYLLNFFFGIAIIIVNRIRRRLVGDLVLDFNVKSNLIIFSAILFIVQFIYLKLWFSFIATIILVFVVWHYNIWRRRMVLLFLCFLFASLFSLYEPLIEKVEILYLVTLMLFGLVIALNYEKFQLNFQIRPMTKYKSVQKNKKKKGKNTSKNYIILIIKKIMTKIQSKNKIFVKKYPKISKNFSNIILGLIILLFLWKISPSIYSGISSDGAISALVAKSLAENFSTTLPTGAEYDRAFLTHFFLSIGIKIFGFNKFGLRIFPILMGIGTILISYLITKKITNSKSISLVTVFTLICSIWLNRYFIWIRMYPFIIFTFLVTTLLLLKFYDKKEIKYIILSLISAIITFFFHRIGILAIIIVSSVFCFEIILKNLKNFRDKKKEILIFSITGIIILIFGINFSLEQVNFSKIGFDSFLMNFLLEEYLFFVVGTLAYLLIVEFPKKEKTFLFSIILLIASLAYSFVIYNLIEYRERYFVMFFPIFIILSFSSIYIILKKLKLNSILIIFISILLSISIISINENFSFKQYEGISNKGYEFVIQNLNNNSIVIGHPSQTTLVNIKQADYWLISSKKEIEKYSLNQDNEYNRFSGAKAIDLEELKKIEKQEKQIFIVWHSYRRKFMSQDLLNHITDYYYYYPKISRQESDNNGGIEVFSYLKIDSGNPCKIDFLPRSNYTYVPECKDI